MDEFKGVKIRFAEVSAFSYATEDESKVIDAALNVIGRELVDSTPQIRKLTGYYNDPILSITFKITHTAERMFMKLIGRLSTFNASKIMEEVGERTDPAGNFYLRLDKQKAYQGVLVPNESDPIRIKIRFNISYSVDPVEAISTYISKSLSDKRTIEGNMG
ncbi:MAG: RNA-binding domain-containing protein [Candidatus Bathyarchaeia archaeon]